MSLIKKLAGETIIYGLSHILSRVLLFVLLAVYLTRVINEVEYGIYSDLYAYSTIILTVLIFRMDTALFRFGSKGALNETFNTGLIFVLGLSTAVLLIAFLYADFFASLLSYPESPYYIQWFALILVFDALTALVFARLRLENRPIKFMFYKLVNVFLTIALVLTFFELIPRYTSMDLSVIIEKMNINRKVDVVFLSNLVASAVVLILMIPEYLMFRWTFDQPLFKKMFWYVLPLVLVAIAGNVNQSFSTPLQKEILGSSVMDNLANAGVYAAAAKLALLLNLFITGFNYAAEPFFFRNSDRSNAQVIYGQVALAFTAVACIAAAGLIAYLDVVILILGEKFREGAYVVPILLFAYIFLGLYYNVSIWYKLKDKTIIGALISLMGMIITLIVSLVLLPKIGVVASAWAALACYVAMVTVGYMVGQKYYPVPYPLKKIGAILLSTVMITWLFQWIKSSDVSTWLYYLVATVIMGVFTALLWFLILSPAMKRDPL